MEENTSTEETVEQTDQPDDQPVDETTDETTHEEETAPEMFPREYVQKLRDESAKYRTKAQRADDLAARLHVALVAATGRLADPTDLPFDESHVDDPEALTAAIDDLLDRKPHLATRKPNGDIGQGPSAAEPGVDLAGILRARAS